MCTYGINYHTKEQTCLQWPVKAILITAHTHNSYWKTEKEWRHTPLMAITKRCFPPVKVSQKETCHLHISTMTSALLQCFYSAMLIRCFLNVYLQVLKGIQLICRHTEKGKISCTTPVLQMHAHTEGWKWWVQRYLRCLENVSDTGGLRTEQWQLVLNLYLVKTLKMYIFYPNLTTSVLNLQAK